VSIRLADPISLVIAFLTVVKTYPNAYLERNEVGNLNIFGDGGCYLGWVDLQTATAYDEEGGELT
jgi:hypothetical protein